MFVVKTIKYFFQAIFIYLFFIIIKIIGINSSRKIFSFIFNKIGSLIKSEKIINANLEKFLGSQNIDLKKNIKLQMWSNYGKTFVEYLFLHKFRNMNSHIQIKGEEIIDKIKKNNKPVIFVSGHFANFELMSMELTKRDVKLATIYRPLNNFFLNPFMEYLRKKYICRNQIKKGLVGVKQDISKSTYNKKRYLKDNKININSNLKKLISILKGCEKNHPAFFEYNGDEFIISIKPKFPPVFPKDLEIYFTC